MVVLHFLIEIEPTEGRCWGRGSSGRTCPNGSGRREGTDWNSELGGAGHGMEEGTGGASGSLQGGQPPPLPSLALARPSPHQWGPGLAPGWRVTWEVGHRLAGKVVLSA